MQVIVPQTNAFHSGSSGGLLPWPIVYMGTGSDHDRSCRHPMGYGSVLKAEDPLLGKLRSLVAVKA